MATVLAMTSMVARGHVGLGAVSPALQQLGHEVIAFPTILLSNHLGHAHVAGMDIAPAKLEAMLDAIEANGWINSVDAVLTGYLPTAAHVDFAQTLVARVRARQPSATYFCDPIMGDLPGGLYIEKAAAEAIRDRLMPAADYLTPNAFELSWLSGRKVSDAPSAVKAARSLPVPVTLVTSVPDSDNDHLANVLVTESGAWCTSAPRLDRVPYGTGDFFTASFVGAWLETGDLQLSLGLATARIGVLISHSLGCDELALVPAKSYWLNAACIPPAAL